MSEFKFSIDETDPDKPVIRVERGGRWVEIDGWGRGIHLRQSHDVWDRGWSACYAFRTIGANYGRLVGPELLSAIRAHLAEKEPKSTPELGDVMTEDRVREIVREELCRSIRGRLATFGTWIHVSERLPSEYGPVLVRFEEPQTTLVMFRKGMHWCYQYNGACCSRTVTHWMPLPEPPEVEGR